MELMNRNGAEPPSSSSAAAAASSSSAAAAGNITTISGLDGNNALPLHESMYLSDGRKIDFVLTFRTVTDGDGAQEKEKRNTQLRQKLLNALLAIGIECDVLLPNDTISGVGFMLLHATFPVLAKYAEALKLQMPLKDQTLNDDDLQPTCKCEWTRIFRHSGENSGDRNDLFTAPFQAERMNIFQLGPDPQYFFSTAQRSLLTEAAVNELPSYGECCTIDAITDAYPLHDGNYKPIGGKSADVHGCDNDRQELYLLWVLPRNFWRFQPLMLIRRYFGEKIALYYAWLGYYNMWLLPVAIIGLIVFLFGLITMPGDTVANDVCNGAASNMKMCPLCDRACDYWLLKESCTYSKILQVFDNEASIFFAILMSLWATCFLEFWKRRQSVLQYNWDTHDFEREERPRAEYARQLRKRAARKAGNASPDLPDFNEVEFHVELQRGLPIYIRVPRYFLSFITVSFMICLVLAVLAGVIIYRFAMIVVFSSIAGQGFLASNVRLLTSLTAACINFICIILLNRIYRRLALVLTNWEQQKTDTSYEDSYTFKVYCFEFVNYYSSVFYIAFFKGYFNGRPGAYGRAFGSARVEECDPAGCLVELVIQMFIIFVAKQILNSLMEIGLPLLSKLIRIRSLRKDDAPPADLHSRVFEKEMALQPVTHLHLFDEYLEMVIQFGFVTLFVAAMPLAPLFALLNNTLEVRLDAWKMVTLMRRPITKRASDIGVWMYILTSVSIMAVITNAVIIGFTSEIIPRTVYSITVGNNSEVGYMQWHLSQFRTSDFEDLSIPPGNATYCYYRDLRHPPGHAEQYQYTTAYWHVLAARMAFVLIFEHLVLFLKGLIDWLVPDIPSLVKEEMRREKDLFKRALFANAAAAVATSNPVVDNPNANPNSANSLAGLRLRKPNNSEPAPVDNPSIGYSAM